MKSMVRVYINNMLFRKITYYSGNHLAIAILFYTISYYSKNKILLIINSFNKKPPLLGPPFSSPDSFF